MKKILKQFCLILSLGLCISGMVLTNPVSINAKVKLNKTNLNLFVSQTFKLKLKGTKKKIKWSSNKKNVATVSSKGLVKAKKVGIAKITAKSKGKKYICTVRVRVNPDQQKNKTTNLPETNTPIPQTTTPSQILHISESDIILLKDEQHTLSLTLNSAAVDNTGVEWSSSDSTVASVANGTVCGLKEGSAIISAKYNGITVTCNVNVEKPYIEKNNITVVKNKTVKLSVKGTTKKITWSVDNLRILQIDENGVVTGKKYGTAKAKASIGNYELTFNITVQDPEVNDLTEKIATTTTNLEKDKKDLEKNQTYLESAQRTLLKAQSTMIKVWDGTQWIYSTDKSAVAAAQADVDYYTKIVEALKIKIPDEENLIASYKRQLDILVN
ncbi:MAG: hypothetical protein HFH14_09780 [Lachnospiraceae bacterium]|nr:hypothetical protein [Lachnospiraceae bacterium]